jgi:methylglyoxal synthase
MGSVLIRVLVLLGHDQCGADICIGKLENIIFIMRPLSDLNPREPCYYM